MTGLRPTERRRDAFLTCVLLACLLAIGYAVQSVWQVLSGVIVAMCGVVFTYVRRRIRR